MIRIKAFFTVGSIVSMALMLMSVLFGFIEEKLYSYPSYSFAELLPEFYWPLFGVAIMYIALGIVAVTLYNKRIKAINIINLAFTASLYMFAVYISSLANYTGCKVFTTSMSSIAIGIAFPLHLVVEIFALISQEYKTDKTAISYTYQAPVSPAPVATPKKVDSNSAIEMLNQLKKLFDNGLLTEEEYNEKRKEYVSQI